MSKRRYVAMVVISALLVAGLGTAARADESPGKIGWQGYDEGLALAGKTGKPLLINFTAAWCKYCKMMKKETYSDPKVIDFVGKHFVPVRVDTQKDRKTAAQYYVRSIPVIWFLKADGEKITSLPGYVDAPTFLQVLGFIASNAFETMSFEDYVDSQEAEG